MKQKILAIDDNKNAIKLISTFFIDQGFEVMTAGDGREAIGLMENNPPDLILLDIMMPRMDGYQFIKSVRRTSGVPIIMLTAKRKEEDVIAMGGQISAESIPNAGTTISIYLPKSKTR